MRVHAIEILALPGARTKALVRQRRSLTRVTQPYYYCCSCTHQQRARERERQSAYEPRLGSANRDSRHTIRAEFNISSSSGTSSAYFQ